MSTNDVPGAKASNNDKLHAGCWAEAKDGSLILVEGNESGTVIFSVFDISKDPCIEFRDAMPEKGFKKDFSNKDWTWHDKTPFPWEKVMEDFPAGSRHASAGGLLTAAERLAQTRGMKAQDVVVPEELKNLTQTAQSVVDKLQKAINKLRS